MKYTGHIENGAVILDEPAVLQDGARVSVEVIESSPVVGDDTPLRGTQYQYIDPFEPAIAPEEWGASE